MPPAYYNTDAGRKSPLEIRSCHFGPPRGTVDCGIHCAEKGFFMFCGNNNNSSIWLVIILIILFFGWGGCGNGCGCNNGCYNNNDCGCGCN